MVEVIDEPLLLLLLGVITLVFTAVLLAVDQGDQNHDDVESGEVVYPDDHEENHLIDGLDDFDGYAHLDSLEEEDIEDIAEVQAILSTNKRQRSIKYRHERKDWAEHVEMLLQTDQFENRFRMPKAHFEYLLEAIRGAITVDFARSSNSTEGNEPIYPEVILAIGLRFVGLGSTVPDLADIYGMSTASARRVINMFLNAIDFNMSCPELQINLPDPRDGDSLRNLASGWSETSIVL